MSESGTADQALAMDRMYRLTRHVYDLTRAYYLLGRDRMLAKVATNAGTATLEVGCGTARNLIKLARRPEPGLLCGLDASQEMLDTAATSIARAGVPAGGHERIRLRQGLAERLDAKTMFEREFSTLSHCRRHALHADLTRRAEGRALLGRPDGSRPRNVEAHHSNARE